MSSIIIIIFLTRLTSIKILINIMDMRQAFKQYSCIEKQHNIWQENKFRRDIKRNDGIFYTKNSWQYWLYFSST